MKILILSDQHFYNQNDQRPDMLRSFLKKVRKEQLHPGVQELWLMGDVFDMLIGNFKFWEKIHQEFFDELSAWTKAKKKIVYIEGNHDFLIKELMERRDVEVYENPTWYMLPQSQERVYLAHGDEVDATNKAYMKWRRTMRSPGFRWVVKTCPEKMAHKLLLPVGEKLSHTSRAMNRLDDVEHYKHMFREFAHRRLNEGARAVFLGHSHVFDHYTQKPDSPASPFYLNLGTWLEGVFRYALWDLESPRGPEVLAI